MEITEKIKTFEDAANATNSPLTIDLSAIPERLRQYIEAQYQMSVIVEALNEGWKPNWNDGNEKKWYPLFSLSSEFYFISAYYGYSTAVAGTGSTLCFKSKELAEYCGKQFVDIWNKILTK